ncbi:DNA-directed RNA polymerase subunit alpha C-terminal domain-containing protein [Paraburkholderia sp. BR14312]|uniref:DNA-directed RNA polymerase subunit alpha C-terminal domain-containing protein n=1 Tax=unclassified Paraburkholderia TaxID=2615204 RepID=UPI0034CD36A1
MYPLESLELPYRITNRLGAAGINRIGQTCSHARHDLPGLPHFGARSLQGVDDALRRAGRARSAWRSRSWTSMCDTRPTPVRAA